MYFSKIKLDKKITNKYKLHQYTRNIFSQEKNRNFVFRVINNYILMYSKNIPIGNLEVKEFPENLNEGGIFTFSMVFCPVIKNDGKKYDLILHERKKGIRKSNEEILLDWFDRRKEKLGFKLNKFRIIKREEQYFYKKTLCKYFEYEIEGILTIEDLKTFKKSLQNGIGDKRAFGCGMLLLKGKSGK